MPSDGDHDDTPLGEFTRRKMKVQVGDGPDRRGEVTVEMTREAGEEDADFGDFYTEVDRTVRLLRDQLGLEDGDA